MSVKIRLQRHGKKGKPFFHIVVADSRAKRDGRFIEKLGTYNPITNPATIELNVDSAVKWLNNGAQPTDTARAILSYKGALYKKHLQGGVAKGAFSEAEAEKRFNTWLAEKEAKIQGKKDGLAKSKDDAKKVALEAENKANEARINAKKQAEEGTQSVQDIANQAPENAEGVVATEGAVVEGGEVAVAQEEVTPKKARKDMTESEKMDLEVQRIKKRMLEINDKIENYNKTNEMLDNLEKNVGELEKRVSY